MKFARSLTAVLAGYAVIYTVLRVFPVPSLGLFVVATVAGAVAGGFVAAWLAGQREIPHAAGVGLLMIATSVFSMRQQGEVQPGWHETTVAGCGPIAAMFGGALRMLSRSRRDD